MAFTVAKDPSAVLDYGWDWGKEGWLIDDDTITASTWTCADEDLVILTDTFDDTTTKVWIKNGTLGAKHLLVNHITTAQGREDDRTIAVAVKNK